VNLVLKDYFELCKPRVVLLMLLTAVVGMLLASPGFVSWKILLLGSLGIALAASAGAVLNHLIDRHIDAVMQRTQRRPIATGRISAQRAVWFAIILGAIGMAVLIVGVNLTTAILTFATLIGYAVIYTVFLKHATPQNIVIGGLAGAMPPLLGWTAVTGQMDYAGWLLVLIIFAWTPPHFWSLSIYRYEDYARADVPMLPVTHGIAYTKLQILLYTFLLVAVSLLPFVVDLSGLVYLFGVIILDGGFLYWSIHLYRSTDKRVAIKTFYYSITYLMLLFILLLIDHYLPILM
jgi:protoheme IX farnesyltransferase